MDRYEQVADFVQHRDRIPIRWCVLVAVATIFNVGFTLVMTLSSSSASADDHATQLLALPQRVPFAIYPEMQQMWVEINRLDRNVELHREVLPLAWQLLVHQDVSTLFSASTKESFTEHANDSSSDAYMVVGEIDQHSEQYSHNGTYTFKLVYEASDPSSHHNVDTIIWEQTSWLTLGSISGFRPISMPRTTDHDHGRAFHGLGKSSARNAILDGNGNEGRWWNSVGITSLFLGGIPAYNGQIASRVKLYIAVMEVMST